MQLSNKSEMIKNFENKYVKSNKNPKRKGKIDLCHGILRCQSIKHKSKIFYNRYKNTI